MTKIKEMICMARKFRTDAQRRAVMSKVTKASIPRILPVYKIEDKLYFRDDRLSEYRNIHDPHDTLPIDQVVDGSLQRPTQRDVRQAYG